MVAQVVVDEDPCSLACDEHAGQLPERNSRDMSWSETLADEFGMVLHPDTAKRWWEKLTTGYNAFRSLSEEELNAAIEWAADERNWTRRSNRVTLAHVRKWLAIKRSTNRREDEALESCGVCNDGFLLMWQSLGPAITMKESMQNHSTIVPCKCSAGRKVMEGSSDWSSLSVEQKSKLKEMADRGIEQHGYLNREAEEAGKHIDPERRKNFVDSARQVVREVERGDAFEEDK